MSTINSTENAFEYVGNPATAALQAQSLASNGPLVVAVDHRLVMMLPSAFNAVTHSPKVGVSLMERNSLFLPGVLFGPDVAENGLHFWVKTARCATFILDLTNAGFDWTAIQGVATDAMPAAVARISAGLKSLPDANRLITLADVQYDSDEPNDAKTGTYYDYMSPALLMAGDGGPAIVAQWMAMVPNAVYKEKEGGRNGDYFTGLLMMMESAVGRDLSRLDGGPIAAAVATWFKRTRAPAGMVPHVEDPTVEIERRAQATHSERFEPLYAVAWRRAYPPLGALWPMEVIDPVTATAALATGLGLALASNGLTPQTLVSTLQALHGFLPFAVGITNADRTAEVLHAFKDAGSNKAAEVSAEAKQQLQADPMFQNFKAAMEGIAPDAHVLMATGMLKDPHAAGILFLNGKLQYDKMWKERAGARTESAMQAVFDNAVSFDTSGETTEWGAILPEGAAKKLCAGRFTTCWWSILEEVATRRDGRQVAARIAKRLHGKPAAALFTDPEAMRVLEKPARACMDLVVSASRNAYSFASVWARLMRMATSIDNLPASCRPKQGLRSRLQEAAGQLMRCPQDRFEAMIATPITAAKRVTEFVIAGQALNAIDHVDANLKRIMREVEDGMHGLANDESNNDYGGGGKGGGGNKKPRNGRGQWDDVSGGHWSTNGGGGWDANTNGGGAYKTAKEWGSTYLTIGIYSNADGTHLACGNMECAFQTAPDLKTICFACVSNPATAYERNKFCANPELCYAALGDAAHERHADFPDSVCKWVQNQNIDWSGYPVTITAHEHRDSGRGGGGRGGGGRGGGGGGKGGGGKGGGKGAGKGGGKGGNNAGGRGKGGGGKGGKGGGKGKGAAFQRQSTQ